MPYISLSAYSIKQNDVFSFTNNQAALAQIKSGGIGVYGERRFLLADNSVYGVAIAVPSKMGNFGLQINYAGALNFNEQKAGLAYARSLGTKVDVGIQFNYYGYKIPAYHSASTINFEAGVIAHVSDKFNIGIHAYNPVGGTLDKTTNEKLASVYTFGAGYDASDNFYFSGEIIKTEDHPVNFTGGIQYQFQKQFFVRGGFRSDTNSGFGGFGFKYKKLRLDVSAGFHQSLGVSPGLLLIYNFKEASE
jgi:hypothetical protein